MHRATLVLAALAGGVFFALAVEFLMRLDEPPVLLFWLPLLLGGAHAGVVVARQLPRQPRKQS